MAVLLTEVCYNIQSELGLHLFKGENLSVQTANQKDEACLDNWSWGIRGERWQDPFFDVWAFSLHAHSSRLTSPYFKACCHKHKKRRKYEESA